MCWNYELIQRGGMQTNEEVESDMHYLGRKEAV